METFTDGVMLSDNVRSDLHLTGIASSEDPIILSESSVLTASGGVKISKSGEKILFMAIGQLVTRSEPVYDVPSTGFFQYWGG
jgi:hypothetical protein